MIWFLIASIVLIIFCWYKQDESDGFIVAGVIAAFLIIFLLICLSICIYNLVSYSVVPDKIKMYQEENKNIENEIYVLVENYKDYESSTFKDIKQENITALITLFPDLKSNELVNKQIDVYVKNNNKIKTLREKLIDRKVQHKLIWLW
jgi:hypothetical protein